MTVPTQYGGKPSHKWLKEVAQVLNLVPWLEKSVTGKHSSCVSKGPHRAFEHLGCKSVGRLVPLRNLSSLLQVTPTPHMQKYTIPIPVVEAYLELLPTWVDGAIFSGGEIAETFLMQTHCF